MYSNGSSAKSKDPHPLLVLERKPPRYPVRAIELLPPDASDWPAYFAKLGTLHRQLNDQLYYDAVPGGCGARHLPPNGNGGGAPDEERYDPHKIWEGEADYSKWQNVDPTLAGHASFGASRRSRII